MQNSSNLVDLVADRFAVGLRPAREAASELDSVVEFGLYQAHFKSLVTSVTVAVSASHAVKTKSASLLSTGINWLST